MKQKIGKLVIINFLAIIVIVFNSCVSMSDRFMGSQKNVTLSQNDLKSKDNKKYLTNNIITAEPAIEKNINVKILLTKTSGTITVNSDAPAQSDATGIDTYRKFVISTAPDGNLIINDTNSKKTKIEISCSNGFLSFNSKSYRGNFIIYSSSGVLMLVNKLELEKYLYGVLPCEVSHSWEKESLKAQAVAARTFAIYNRLRNTTPEYDLDSGVFSQVYKGRDVEAKSTNEAIDETAGEVLAYNGVVIQAFFHANSGGRTASSEEVWGGRNDYLVSVDDPYSNESKGYKWAYKTTREKLTSVIAKNKPGLGTIYEMSVIDKTESNRVKTVRVKCSDGEIIIKGKDLRTWLGVDQLRSTNFTIHSENDDFYFDGYGWGHGVGMSQEGARQLAKIGRTYKEILHYYYKNTKIKKIKIE